MSSAAASMTLSPKAASRPSLPFCLKAPVGPKVVSRLSLRTSSAAVQSMIVSTMHEQGGFPASTSDYSGGVFTNLQPAGHLDRAVTTSASIVLGMLGGYNGQNEQGGFPDFTDGFLGGYNGQHEQGGFPASTSDYSGGFFTNLPSTQPAGHLDRPFTTGASIVLGILGGYNGQNEQGGFPDFTDGFLGGKVCILNPPHLDGAASLHHLGIPPSSSDFLGGRLPPRISRPLSPPLVEWGSSAHQCRLRTFSSCRSVIVRAASTPPSNPPDGAPTPPSNPPDGARSLPPPVVKWIVRTCQAAVEFKPKTGSGPVEIGISFGVFIMFNGHLKLGTDLLIYISWVASLVLSTICSVMELDDVTHAGVSLNVDDVKTEMQGLKAEVEGLTAEVEGLTAKVNSLLGMQDQLMSKFDGIAATLNNKQNGGIIAPNATPNATSLNNKQNGGITGLSPQA